MNAAPATDASVPETVTPPDVPAGSGLNEMMGRGEPPANVPTSVAHGSAAGGAGGKGFDGYEGRGQATRHLAHFGPPRIGGRSGESPERGGSPRGASVCRRKKGSRREHAAVREDLHRVTLVALLDNSA